MKTRCFPKKRNKYEKISCYVMEVERIFIDKTITM